MSVQLSTSSSPSRLASTFHSCLSSYLSSFLLIQNWAVLFMYRHSFLDYSSSLCLVRWFTPAFFHSNALILRNHPSALAITHPLILFRGFRTTEEAFGLFLASVRPSVYPGLFRLSSGVLFLARSLAKVSFFLLLFLFFGGGFNSIPNRKPLSSPNRNSRKLVPGTMT